MINKILYFHPVNDFTGSTRVLANLIEEKTDITTYVVTYNKGLGFLSFLPQVKILPLWVCNVKYLDALTWRLSWLFWSIICLFRFNEYYINTIIPFYPAFIGWLFGKKIVYHVHEKHIIYNYTIRIAEFVFNHIKSTRIYVSNYLKEQYLPKKGTVSIVKYNKLPKSFLGYYEIIPIEKRSLKEILLIASLTKAKGIDMFVEIANNMANYNFTMVLSTSRENINRYFGQRLPSNLSIFPAQEDVRPFILRADLLLNLSQPQLCVETYGMTILEAMAFQVPSIVPNIGGPLELVENGLNGYCVNTSDINEVCFAIRKSLQPNNYKLLYMGTIVKLKQINEHE